MRKRILRKIVIDEISAVDRPAQRGADVRIFKRHTHEGTNEMNTADDIDRHGLALLALEGAAAAIRKEQPALSKEQAFARALREHPDIAATERREARARLYPRSARRPPPPDSAEPALVKRDDALAALEARAAEIRKAMPNLSREQSFARAYAANRELAQAERGAARAALYA